MGEAALSARSNHYRPRSPQISQYYQCIEDNFETFIDAAAGSPAKRKSWAQVIQKI